MNLPYDNAPVYDYGEGGPMPVPAETALPSVPPPIEPWPNYQGLFNLSKHCLTTFALSRASEVIELRKTLASVMAERDRYKKQIDKSIRTLEGW